MTVANGRAFLSIPGPTTVPDEVLAAMHRPAVDIYTGPLIELTMSCEGQVAPWSGKVVDPSIVAVKVGALTEK